MNQDRYDALIRIGCLCCRIIGEIECGITEVHHLNAGGHAGQKRLGDDYTIPLGSWHHRGEPPSGYSAMTATARWGPSLARSSKEFRRVFGNDRLLLGLV